MVKQGSFGKIEKRRTPEKSWSGSIFVFTTGTKLFLLG